MKRSNSKLPVLSTSLMLILVAVFFQNCGKSPLLYNESSNNSSYVWTPPPLTDGSTLYSENSWLVGTWQGQGSGHEAFKLTVDSSNNTYAEEVSYQVGREGDPDIPYPTGCTYRIKGIIAVKPPRQDVIDSYLQAGRETPQLSILTQPSSYELIDVPDNSSACSKFIQRANAKYANNIYSYNSSHIKKITNDAFEDVWYIFQYKKIK